VDDHWSLEAWVVKQFWHPWQQRVLRLVGVALIVLLVVLNAASGHGWLADLFGPIHYTK
jgi:hypothetical protein